MFSVVYGGRWWWLRHVEVVEVAVVVTYLRDSKGAYLEPPVGPNGLRSALHCTALHCTALHCTGFCGLLSSVLGTNKQR